MHIQVIDQDYDDGFHQKCFVSCELFNSLSFFVGQVVEIQTGAKRYINSVWVGRAVPSDAIYFNKQVSLTAENHDSHTTNIFKTLTPTKANRITVDVILTNINDVEKAKKCVSPFDDLPKTCLNILNHLYLANNYVVNCSKSKYSSMVGIAYIIIQDASQRNSGTTADCLSVDMKCIVKINTIHSLEWFNQINRNISAPKPGGIDFVLSMLKDLVCLPFTQRENFAVLGVKPPRGILLRGPPGCGKTSLVRYLAESENILLVSINGPEIFDSLPGETESNLRKIFEKTKLLSQEGPCILFVDEIDSVCPRRGVSSSTNASRATAQFLDLLDGMDFDDDFLVIGATNRPSAVDQALRRPGRLDREVLISPPDLHQRLEILHMNVTSFPVVGDLDLAAIATITNGYVGADLKALCQEASYLAMAECKDSGENVLINQEHFIRASRQIRPSLQKGAEGVVDVRPVSWGDIGGLHEVKRQLQQAVEWPLKHPEAFKRMGLSPPRGVLLYGPPGCCKTTLVRAAATSCHVTFLSISGAQLYSPYVGDSERLISEVFHKARACAPSILFLDEIDSIIGKRSETGNHGVGERILSALLNEMDGIGVRLGEASGSAKQKLLEGSSQGFIEKSQTTEEADNKQVLVVAASNRPDMLDEALMRPGRMDRVIYVGPPDVVARHQILSVYTRGWGLSDVTLGQLAQETDMYTGADLESLCREAALCALTENLEAAAVSHDHFRRALTSVRPSLTQEIIRQYTSLAFHAVR